MTMHKFGWYFLTTLLFTALLAGPALAGAGGPCGTSGPPHPIPEPSALALLGVGVSALLAMRRRGKKKD
jgi:hypothetical protein